MKTKLKSNYIIVILIFFCSTTFAQWERTLGPNYGGVNSMAFQAPYLFAATPTGLFRTSDNGLNWKEVHGLPENTINGLAVKGNKIFAACYYSGLYVSNDFGATWEKAGTEIPVGGKTGVTPTIPYYKLYSTPNYIYCCIGGFNNRIFRSSDDGKSWQLFLSNQYVNDMIQDGDTILINNSTNTTISINNGASFTAVTGLSLGVNNKVYLGKINNTWVGALPNTSNPFRYSTNGGTNFSNGTIPGIPPFTIKNIITVGNTILISSNAGIYQSTDGITWSVMNLPPPVQINVNGYGFIHENNGDLWAGSFKFYLSQNQGSSFTERNNGLTSNSFLGKYYFNDGDNYLYTSDQNNGTLLRSSDQGDTWNSIGTGFPLEGSVSRFIKSHGGTYFAGTDSGLYKSVDNGNTWNKITNGLPTGTYSPNDLIKGNSELYLATTNNGVYKSIDSGLTWIAANSGFTTLTISKLQWHQNKLFAGSPGGLLMSPDSGLSWTSLSSSLSVIERRVVDFSIVQDSIYTCFNYSKIYRSYDSGATWNLLNTGVNPSNNLPGEIQIIDTLYFFSNPTFNRGVYMCSSNNTVWSQINAGLKLDSLSNCTETKEFTNDPNYIYLNGYAYGCYRLPLNSVLMSGRLSGKVYWDKNNNGTRQANEPFLQNQSLKVDPNAIVVNTDTSGTYRYNYFSNTPTYTIQLYPQPYWIITSSPSPKIVTPMGLTIDSLNFGVNILSGITDVSVELNANVHRPGSRPNYFLVVKNIGTDTLSNTVTITLDNNLTYLSGTTPQSINGNTLTFAYSNLKPGESNTFLLNTELSNTVLAGTILNSTATVLPVVGDTVPSNNFVECKPLVQASFDPNNKTVEPSGNIGHQDLLKYQINFQNTGTDTAFTVIIRDTISPLLDMSTFHFISASHTLITNIRNGNVLEFRFDQILLPDSNIDEPNSHGYVCFQIQPHLGLPLNTVINNTAAIYFDYNSPVITNTTNNTITGFTSMNETQSLQPFTSYAYPNPFSTSTLLTFNSNETGRHQLQVYDIEGRILIQDYVKESPIRINRNKLSSGIYLYNVTSPSGKKSTGKLIVK
ncbi:MAG: T9SS type A sorting domain-containing protein [Bacteroidetes bacterium]|nr:T9SS type A sorting domain-containing protein [Bacteroidota bacterium]